MAGAVLVVLALLALIPMFLVGGGILMAVCGHLFVKDAEAAHVGSELIETNV